MAVVKDEAYGHGALDVARVRGRGRRVGLRLGTLEEAMTLRDAGNHRAAAAARRTAGG